ncbi:unnamed protein product [Nippostrongylus brasiliensis]|uniref:Secreted protein n=1 Tax=Nippostrongylus brasiliensis TaxID=27835 RepID=A0A0N4XVF9_NIPBR|nr:unnamed protein product [Nippostrongylus brasiliensis]
MWSIFAFLAVLQSVSCMRNADETEWNSGNAIVIFARGQSHRKRAVGTIKRDDNIAILEINRIKDEVKYQRLAKKLFRRCALLLLHQLGSAGCRSMFSMYKTGGYLLQDDIGLPLECMLDDVTWTQVGFLESVTRAVNEDEPDEAIPVTCESITKFTFWIFNTDDLPKLLEEYSMDVLASASRCFHRYKTFRALTSGLENN